MFSQFLMQCFYKKNKNKNSKDKKKYKKQQRFLFIYINKSTILALNKCKQKK